MSATATETPIAKDDTKATAAPEAGAQVAAAVAAGIAPGAKQEAQQPADGKPAEKQAEGQAYDFKLPEGIAKDDPVLVGFAAQAKAAGLTQEQAQAFVDGYLKSGAEAQSKALAEYQRTRESWRAEIQSDPELGGARIPETVERARRSVTRYGSPQLLTLLDESGLGDNPEVLRFLCKVDRATAEDRSPAAPPAGEPRRPVEDRLYPSMK